MIGKLFKKLAGSDQPSGQAQGKTKGQGDTAAKTSKKPDGQGQKAKKAQGKSQHPQGQKRRNNRRRKPKPEAPAWDISQFEVPEEEGKTRFHDLDLPDPLMHAMDSGKQYETHKSREFIAVGEAGYLSPTGKADTERFNFTP